MLEFYLYGIRFSVFSILALILAVIAAFNVWTYTRFPNNNKKYGRSVLKIYPDENRSIRMFPQGKEKKSKKESKKDT